MSGVYSILIDLGVLGAFGFLYYWLQKRRIIKASTLEIQERIQELLYDLHSYLEKHKSASFYSELDNYAVELERAANTHDLGEMRLAVKAAPQRLPDNLKAELNSIEELF